MSEACCAAGCQNRRDPSKNIEFYRIPVEKDRRKKWLAAINRKGFLPTVHSRLCNEHFVSGKKSNHPFSPDFVPSIFGPTPKKRKAVQSLSMLRRHQQSKRSRVAEQEKKDVATSVLSQAVKNEEKASISEVDALNKSTQTDLLGEDITALNAECENLRKKLSDLKRKPTFSFDMQSFKIENVGDERVKYFTGLPSLAVFMALLNFLLPCLSKEQILSPFQQLLLFLMRLRLNLNIEFLALCFGVTRSTASTVILDILDVSYNRLVPALIIWPKRKQVRLTLPEIFEKEFTKCICIIDCFEIFIERPIDLKARAQTYSHDKSNNTMKYLIAVTPQGAISFISKGWGGGTTDKFVTENCGFLDKLLPGDLILAEREFDIETSIGLKGAQIKIPAFTRRKKQLSGLASVRIHVEKVVGRARIKYTILRSTIPLTFLTTKDNGVTTLDKIVHVCCALTSLGNSSF